jgi:hypothetical protein
MVDIAACRVLREWLFIFSSYFTFIHLTLVGQQSKEVLARKTGHRTLTSKVRALSHGTPRGIYGGNNSIVTGFFSEYSSYVYQFHSTNVPFRNV